MATRFEDICPIEYIGENVIVRGDGSVTVGLDLMLPEAYSLTVEDYKNMHNSFVTALSMLPVYTTVHHQNFFYIDQYKSTWTEGDKRLMSETLNHFHMRPILKHYSRMYITFSSEGKPSNRKPIYFLNVLNWVAKPRFKNLAQIQLKIENYTEAFINNLASIRGCKAKRMDTGSLLCAFYEYFSLSYNSPGKDAEKVKELIIPEICFPNNMLQVGGQFVSVISMKTEPEGLLTSEVPQTHESQVYKTGIQYDSLLKYPCSFIFPLGLGMPVNHILNTVIEIQENQYISKNIKKEITGLNVAANLGFTEASNKRDAIETFTNALSKENYRGCLLNVNVILNDPDPLRLETLSQLALASFQKIRSATAWREIEDCYYAFANSSPGSANVLVNEQVSTLRHSACYFHLESQYLSDRKGILFVDRFGAPVVLNMWDSPKINNRNKLIIGDSGGGKSFLLNNIISQSLNFGNHILGLDIGYSYKRNLIFENGKHFDASRLDKFRFNIFLCDKDENGKYIYKEDTSCDEDVDLKPGERSEKKYIRINYVVDILSVIWSKNIDVDTLRIMETTVESYYEHVNKNSLFPDLTNFYEFTFIYESQILKPERRKYLDFESFRMSLERYIKGGVYENLLNAKEPIDILNDRFIIFDLEAISKSDERLFNIVCFMIIDLIMQKINKLEGIKKTVFIDEALDFLKNPKMGPFIAYLFRTIRKKEGELFLLTQDSKFFKALSEDVRASIIGQSHTKILLPNSSDTGVDDLVEMGLLSSKNISLFKSLYHEGKNYREFLVQMGSWAMVLRNEVSEFAHYAYTSKQSQIVKLEELFEKSHNMADAIDQYIELSKKEVV